MLPLATGLAVLIGAILGLLGGGGAILMLPMLVYVIGIDPRAAIAISLFVVGSTSTVGGAIHARTGNVRWRSAGTFGIAAMTGAFAGGRVAVLVPARVLLLLFATIMLATASTMLRRRDEETSAPRTLSIARMLPLGAAVGFLSGLVGSGGGFLIVPTLSLLGGLRMREAIGTSLVVIALQSFAGFAGHIQHVTLEWTLVAAVTSAAAVGTIGGSLLGRRVSPGVLRRAFAWLVLVMGVSMLVRQLWPR